MKRIIILAPSHPARSGAQVMTASRSLHLASARRASRSQTGTDGLTVEQRNIRDRLKIDNLPGSIKHLYVISAYSGQVLLYSTVRGKITSGGKRLTPSMVAVQRGSSADGFYVTTWQ
jgi:hypothetical protein